MSHKRAGHEGMSVTRFGAGLIYQRELIHREEERMSDEGPADADHVGVELLVASEMSEELDGDDDYAPASGTDRNPWQPWRAARVTRVGQDALNSAARLVEQQVGTVVREALAGMDGADLAGSTAAGLQASSVQLTFGVKLTTGVGKAIEAIVTAGGDASVQVVVTLNRPS